MSFVCCLLGNSPASEFDMLMFRNTPSVLSAYRRVGMKYDWIWEKLEYLYGKRYGSKIAIFEPFLFLYRYCNFSQIQSHFIPTRLWRWNRQSVPKRLHIKFRCRGITQKTAYNIQNMAKVLNQEYAMCVWLTSIHFCSSTFQKPVEKCELLKIMLLVTQYSDGFRA